MSAKIIDGKSIAARIRESVKSEADKLRREGHAPCLAAVLSGSDAAARSYAQSQARRSADVGIDYRLVELAADSDMPSALDVIDRLNGDSGVSGIMLHLPLPQGLDAFELQQRIVPSKDVEGVGAGNLGLLMMGRDALAPCTAAAAFTCLQESGIEIKGRETVVIGRSVIVGKPLATLLLAAHATVTQCHTRTRDLATHTRRAEVLMVAAGVPQLIGREHVSPGAVVIDVGTHRVPDPNGEPGKVKTVGDVRFDEVVDVASAITPVPGGVGPVTVAMLLANTVAACRRGTND